MSLTGQSAAAAIECVHGHDAVLGCHGALEEEHAREIAVGSLQFAVIIRLRLNKSARQLVAEDRQVQRIGQIAVICADLQEGPRAVMKNDVFYQNLYRPPDIAAQPVSDI